MILYPKIKVVMLFAILIQSSFSFANENAQTTDNIGTDTASRVYSQEEVQSLALSLTDYLLTPNFDRDFKLFMEGVNNQIIEISKDDSLGWFSTMIQNQEERFQLIINDLSLAIEQELSIRSSDSIRMNKSELDNRIHFFQESFEDLSIEVNKKIRNQRKVFAFVAIAVAYISIRSKVRMNIDSVTRESGNNMTRSSWTLFGKTRNNPAYHGPNVSPIVPPRGYSLVRSDISRLALSEGGSVTRLNTYRVGTSRLILETTVLAGGSIISGELSLEIMPGFPEYIDSKLGIEKDSQE